MTGWRDKSKDKGSSPDSPPILVSVLATCIEIDPLSCTLSEYHVLLSHHLHLRLL